MARRHARFVRPNPRTKMWIGAGVGDETLSGSTLTFSSSYSAGALLLRPFTILRTRMDILFYSDQEAADETYHGTYGEVIVTDAAVAVGVTALPNPSGVSGDPEQDWFVWQAMSGRAVVTAVGNEGLAGWHYVIDSKAMRKVGPSDDSVTMIDMEGAAGARIVTNGRQLIQLH